MQIFAIVASLDLKIYPTASRPVRRSRCPSKERIKLSGQSWVLDPRIGLLMGGDNGRRATLPPQFASSKPATNFVKEQTSDISQEAISQDVRLRRSTTICLVQGSSCSRVLTLNYRMQHRFPDFSESTEGWDCPLDHFNIILIETWRTLRLHIQVQKLIS